MVTNLKGYTILSMLVGKVMQQQKSGNILNITSVIGAAPVVGLGLKVQSGKGIYGVSTVVADALTVLKSKSKD